MEWRNHGTQVSGQGQKEGKGAQQGGSTACLSATLRHLLSVKFSSVMLCTLLYQASAVLDLIHGQGKAVISAVPHWTFCCCWHMMTAVAYSCMWGFAIFHCEHFAGLTVCICQVDNCPHAAAATLTCAADNVAEFCTMDILHSLFVFLSLCLSIFLATFLAFACCGRLICLQVSW